MSSNIIANTIVSFNTANLIIFEHSFKVKHSIDDDNPKISQCSFIPNINRCHIVVAIVNMHTNSKIQLDLCNGTQKNIKNKLILKNFQSQSFNICKPVRYKKHTKLQMW